MKGLKIVFCLAVFLFCSTYSWAEWYPGIIHAHSTFSDGARNPEELISQAKQAGARFLFVTDHYEQIDGLYQSDGQLKLGARFAVDKAPVSGGGYTAEWVLKLGFQDYGFDRYRRRFLAQANSDFVVIPGAEITTFWGIDVASHTLALSDMGYSDKEILVLQTNKDKETQQELIKLLRSKGILTVAAHPNLVTLAQYPRVWEIGNFQFDPGNTKQLSGIEFFNDNPFFSADAEGYSRTFRFYLLQQRSGDQVFVTSGCDSHFPKINLNSPKYSDSDDPNRWARKTWVYCKELNQKSLLEAMAQGHTYAAQYGASLENLNYIPGFQAQEVERPKFQFFVAFDKKITSSKTIRIYRDGKLVESSIQTHKKENIEGLQKIAYVWEDAKAESGEHSYVIEVEGVLITSPIRLKVGRTSKEKDADNILATYYVAKDFENEGFLELRKDNTCRLASFGKWIIKVKRIRWLSLDGSYRETFQYTVIIMREPLRATEDEGDHDRIIMAEPLRQRAGPGKQFISLNTPFVGYIEGEMIKEQQSGDKLISDERAVLIKSSEDKLWSSYLAQKGKASFEFKEDGRVCLYTFGKWEIKVDVLTIQFVFGDEEISLKGKIKDSTLEMEGGIVMKKEEEKNLR